MPQHPSGGPSLPPPTHAEHGFIGNEGFAALHKWRSPRVDQDVIGSGTISIPDLGIVLSLDEIYADPWGEGMPGEA